MILLEPSNRILAEVVSSQINREADQKIEAMDVRLCDFDDVTYHVVSDPKAKTMTVSMGMPCYNQFVNSGGSVAVESHYAGLVTDTEQGYDVTLSFSLETLPMKAEDLIQKISMFKANILGGVWDYFFTSMMNGKKENPFSFKLRADTEVYFVPAADRVTVIFSVDFVEHVDRAIAKIFLQEFADARRHLGAAPPVSFTQNPPLEMKEFGITQPTGNLGFVSFAVMKSHLEKGKQAQVVAVLQSFRNYLQYHIKCSKAYFHSRMRARVVAMLAILNRAHVEPFNADSKEKKTISGKTFTRA